MDNRKQILRQTGEIALGVALCTGLMLVIYYGLGKFSTKVLWGAMAGLALGVLNFLAMAVTASRAADKAQEQDVRAGKALMQGSYLGRMVLLFVILVVLAKAGLCDPLAMVIPLVFVRPVITMIELMGKKKSKEEPAK